MNVHSIDSWLKAAQIAQGFSTPVIAVLLGLFTIRFQRRQAKNQERQAETQRLQHRLALLDRRMKVFDAAFEFIVLVFREGRMASLEPVFKLAGESRECYLLFGAEIREYIDELSSKGIELNTIYAMRSPEGVMRPEDIRPHTELKKWFSGQTKILEEKFLKYIDFREP